MRVLVGAGDAVGNHARELHSLPETVPVMNALARCRGRVNRWQWSSTSTADPHHRGPARGEIYDEFDRDVISIERAGDGWVLVAGGFPVHDLEDIGVDLPRGDYTTVAGDMLEALDHVPRSGKASKSAITG